MSKQELPKLHASFFTRKECEGMAEAFKEAKGILRNSYGSVICGSLYKTKHHYWVNCRDVVMARLHPHFTVYKYVIHLMATGVIPMMDIHSKEFTDQIFEFRKRWLAELIREFSQEYK